MKTTKTIIALMLLCSVLSSVAFAFDPIYINFQPAASAVPAGYLVDSGEVYGDRGNGYTYGWDTFNGETRDRGVDADQRYDTLNHMQKGGQNDTWEIEILNGTYDIDIVLGDPANTDQINHVMLEDVLLVDPDGEDTFDEHFGIVVIVSDGKLTLTPNLTSPNIADNAKVCYIDIYMSESDPPTPDPATFASAPAAISESSISMTATTGSDASGPVEYYFTATDGGNDSGWQTSTSYTDTGLAAATQYTYTVTMSDGLGNTGTASSPASATTDADIYPPTPDPATFAMAPAADSGTVISMTATAGSDTSVPVEYYFDETSGNSGGTDSGWQTSASYTDSGLQLSTQYCYTVQMRDSAIPAPNTGAASAPYCATTLGLPVDVPDVTGQAQATAESNIVAAGLIVGTVTTTSSGSVPEGNVISQNPTGGASIPSGSPVDLVISTGFISWVPIITDDFEGGFGNWTDGGSNCFLDTDSANAHQGNNSVNLQGNTSTSVMSTGDLSLLTCSELKVEFWYKTVGMDSTDEDFWLQISTDGGSNYVTVEEWNLNDEFVNDQFYFDSVIITGFTLTNQTRIRFRCDASAGDDDVYIDEVNVMTLTPDYLAFVEAYADAMIADGRDTYGPEHSPLFASALDRYTMQIGDFGSIDGERDGDRSLRGSNPQEDLGLYAILYRLTELKGQKQYAEEADKSLEYFFTRCQSPVTGLMTWGEHIFWHLENEAMGGNDIHEMSSEWPLWDECYRLAPDASWNFAIGLWDHQIANQSTGDFSRHTQWSTHGPGTGTDFARYAGQMIASWTDAYIRKENAGRARRSDLITAITTLVTRMENNMDTPTGYLRAGTNSAHDYFSWPSHTMRLARYLTSSAPHIEDGVLAGRMRDLAIKLDIDFAQRVGHLINVGGGYVATVDVATGIPIPRDMNDPYTTAWVTAYGAGVHAKMANRSFQRYEQLKESHPSRARRYEQLILSAADQYLNTTPDTSTLLKPGAFMAIIDLMLNSYSITDEAVYLERANYFGQLGIMLFLDDGLPLPKASNQNDWYECITGGTDFMHSLLKLYEALDAD